MPFPAAESEMLRPERGGIIGATRPHHALFITDQQLESVLAHRGEMRAARNEADVGADAGQLYPEISADRAGAVDAYLHGNLRESRMAKNFRRSSPVGFEGHLKAVQNESDGRLYQAAETARG